MVKCNQEAGITLSEREVIQMLLRDVRIRAGLTQHQLADRLNKPQSYVSKYELGERRLDLLELRKVCHAVGITIADFIAFFEQRLERNER